MIEPLVAIKKCHFQQPDFPSVVVVYQWQWASIQYDLDWAAYNLHAFVYAAVVSKFCPTPINTIISPSSCWLQHNLSHHPHATLNLLLTAGWEMIQNIYISHPRSFRLNFPVVNNLKSALNNNHTAFSLPSAFGHGWGLVCVSAHLFQVQSSRFFHFVEANNTLETLVSSFE